MAWQEAALVLAGVIGSGVAVVHGILTQRLMVRPLEAFANAVKKLWENAGTYLTRRDGLAGSQARLRLPTACVVHRLTGAIETALARAPFADREWVRRHFIHLGAWSYFIIPNAWIRPIRTRSCAHCDPRAAT